MGRGFKAHLQAKSEYHPWDIYMWPATFKSRQFVWKQKNSL